MDGLHAAAPNLPRRALVNLAPFACLAQTHVGPLDVGKCALLGMFCPAWEKAMVLGLVFDQWHRATPHARLVQCSVWSPVFFREWVRTSGPLDDLAWQWLHQASPVDVDHISKLRVPHSFMDTVLREQLGIVPFQVAWH